MKRIKKRYYVLVFTFLLLFILFYSASTLIRNYVVKNGEKLVGRKINLSELHINYAKVAIEMKDFALFEANKTDTFVSFKDFYINFDPWALVSNEFAFSEIRLESPYVSVIQNDTIFNFTDIINFFADTAQVEPKKVQAVDTAKSEMKYSVANFDLKNGRVHYADKKVKSKFDLNKLNLQLPYIAWDSKNADMGVNFNIGDGSIGIDSKIYPATKDYHFRIKTRNLSMEPFTAYMKDYMLIKSFKGLLNTDINLNGNYENVMNLVVSGKVSLAGLSMVDQKGIEFTKAANVAVNLDSIDLGRSYYRISRIEITKPKLVAELNKKETNIESIFAPLLVTDTTATQPATTDTVKLVYIVDSMKINQGEVDFADNTLNRPFRYKLLDLNFSMGQLTESATKIPIDFSVILNQYGTLKGKTTFNMVETMDLALDMNISDMDLASFAPYTEYYVARPVTNGKLDYACKLKMTPKMLDNSNKVLFRKIDFGKKTKDTTAMKVPVMLGLIILRDSKGNIGFDLPVSGNPSDPKFKYGKLIWQTFVNLMVKAASEPFKALGNLLGTDPESMKKIDFELGQDSLGTAQLEKLNKIVDLKAKKPELAYTFTQETGLDEEKAVLAVSEVKRKLITEKYNLTDEAQIIARINALSNKDTALVKYLDAKLPDAKGKPIEEKCLQLIGNEKAMLLINSLVSKRNSLIWGYLISKGFAPAAVKVQTGDLLNLAEQQRSPKFKVEVRLD
jgi:hypothetical protein